MTIEFEPAPVRRPRRLPGVLAVAAVVGLIAAGLAKPWGSPVVSPSPPLAGAAASFSTPGSAAPAMVTAGLGDGQPLSATVRPDPATTAEIVSWLTPRAGAWGIGTGGSGPRMVRDDPWVDWVPVNPVASGPGSNVAIWPGTGLCHGVPALAGNAALVAVTVPPGIVPDWRLVAWWTDAVSVVRLDGIVRQVSPAGNRGISFLERADDGRWPDGRYEFHTVAGNHEVTLTVCLQTP